MDWDDLRYVLAISRAGGLNGAAIQTRKIIEEGVQKVLSGSSVDAALKEAKTRADAALAEYNANFK